MLKHNYINQNIINNSTIANNSSIAKVHIKEPMSALTHFIGCIFAILFTPVIIVHAAYRGATLIQLISISVFMISMFLLYGASASYHSFNLQGKAGLRLKRMDHMMIFVLIAGSYTPICVITLGGTIVGKTMLIAIWIIAILGMLFKLFWVTCPKWVSSIIYIAMGWVVIFAFPTLLNTLDRICFTWLLVGGIIYTIGGVIYALKLVKFNDHASLWGSHEIFHLFVMGGSLCHFICMYNLFK